MLRKTLFLLIFSENTVNILANAYRLIYGISEIPVVWKEIKHDKEKKLLGGLYTVVNLIGWLGIRPEDGYCLLFLALNLMEKSMGNSMEVFKIS